MNLGLPEIFVILLVALIVFGPQKLPEVARQIGVAMRHLRQMQDTVRAELDTVLHPDLNPSPADDRPGIEEPDHTQGATPEVVELPPAEPNDDGFAGPPGSFL
ncbi:MAG TPA: twin-arginine translocase TatA/TatE family subunit [Acidimicrobiia bacterium]|nr:twin-arginine translocase TatA/TatE family subunit [Acidimicrobiia bacterium]